MVTRSIAQAFKLACSSVSWRSRKSPLRRDRVRSAAKPEEVKHPLVCQSAHLPSVRSESPRANRYCLQLTPGEPRPVSGRQGSIRDERYDERAPRRHQGGE